jgi:hypothetical protein
MMVYPFVSYNGNDGKVKNWFYLCLMKNEQSNIKKKLEEKIKLKLIIKYPHIHKLYLDGEITLKQAYDGSQSEMLGVETFKSKGTKKFITHSTKIKDSKSESPYPYQKHPFIESSVFNCE